MQIMRQIFNNCYKNVHPSAIRTNIIVSRVCKITLGDLLDIYYGKKTYAKYDNSALQWNRFVKDFCADPATNRFPDKLKTAAALWRIVRESTMEKKYTSELLEKIDNQ